MSQLKAEVTAVIVHAPLFIICYKLMGLTEVPLQLSTEYAALWKKDLIDICCNPVTELNMYRINVALSSWLLQIVWNMVCCDLGNEHVRNEKDRCRH